MEDLIAREYKRIIESNQTLQYGFEWGTTMHIPFRAVSPNGLHSKFLRVIVKDEEKFLYLEHEMHKEMFSRILEILRNPQEHKKWYFEGPPGIGKSCALLYIVLVLRKFLSNEFRVIYINNPFVLERSSFVNELIYAFAEDEKEFSALSPSLREFTLEQWHKHLFETEIKEREASYQEFLEAAQKICLKKNLKIIGVFDQENEALHQKKQDDYNFPYSYYNNIPGVDYLITCASTSNWHIVNKSLAWQNLTTKMNISFRKFAFSGKLE